jgi:hypothetical protein
VADDLKTDPAKGDAVEPDPTTAGQTADSVSGIRPAMSEQEIRDAGIAIDVPFESGEPNPQRLRYANLGKQWTPPEDWTPGGGAGTEPVPPEGETA